MSVTALQRAVERVNAGDLDGYMELYAADVQVHGYPPGIDSFETLRAFYAGFFAGLSDVRLELHEIVSEGDLVAARYVLSGTHTGELMGVPATGRAVSIDGQSFFRFSGDEVVVRWQSMDALGLLTQLGALPAPS
ncbi:MAG TPA: ester cyclase [Solirubrobacteraceae bacterium]|jgi:predicted ester cyclase